MAVTGFWNIASIKWYGSFSFAGLNIGWDCPSRSGLWAQVTDGNAHLISEATDSSANAVVWAVQEACERVSQEVSGTCKYGVMIDAFFVLMYRKWKLISSVFLLYVLSTILKYDDISLLHNVRFETIFKTSSVDMYSNMLGFLKKVKFYINRQNVLKFCSGHGCISRVLCKFSKRFDKSGMRFREIWVQDAFRRMPYIATNPSSTGNKDDKIFNVLFH